MSYNNRLPADQIASLEPGDTVIIESSIGTFARSQVRTGKVAKLTAKQVVVHYPGVRGTTEVRFRKQDAGQVGDGYGYLLDPTHPTTVDRLARDRRESRRQQIDALAGRWSRERDNLNLLRQLHTAVGEYLDAES